MCIRDRFIVAQYLRVRCGAVFLTMANQEREVLGLSNPVVHDTDMAVRVGVEALKKLIAQDRMTKQMCIRDSKRSARIALQRNGRMSLARPAAGGESCFAGFIFIV